MNQKKESITLGPHDLVLRFRNYNKAGQKQYSIEQEVLSTHQKQFRKIGEFTLDVNQNRS